MRETCCGVHGGSCCATCAVCETGLVAVVSHNAIVSCCNAAPAPSRTHAPVPHHSHHSPPHLSPYLPSRSREIESNSGSLPDHHARLAQIDEFAGVFAATLRDKFGATEGDPVEEIRRDIQGQVAETEVSGVGDGACVCVMYEQRGTSRGRWRRRR